MSVIFEIDGIIDPGPNTIVVKARRSGEHVRIPRFHRENRGRREPIEFGPGIVVMPEKLGKKFRKYFQEEAA